MDYTGNSNKAKEKSPGEKSGETIEKQQIKKVTNAKVKKQSEFGKFVSVFLPEGGMTIIKDHIINDMIIPTVKQIIDDTVHITLYGTPAGKRGGVNQPQNRTSYSSIFDRRREESRYSRYDQPTRSSSIFKTEDIVFEARLDAEDVLNYMEGLIVEYGCVSMADMYEMVGQTSPYTDYNYGWHNLESARIVPVRGGGFGLDLPVPVRLPLYKG